MKSNFNLSELKVGERARIVKYAAAKVPLKMLELGCLPGNEVEILLKASHNDPIYICMNDNYIAIRKDTAKVIYIEKI